MTNAQANKIEFGYIKVGDIARKHMNEVLDSNWISMGPKVKEFETQWGDICELPFNKAVSSGTDAVINMCLALYDFGAREGMEIITPALSFIATANAIRAAGFIPKFVDIKRETLNINEDLIEAAISDKTAAIMVVHTMGRMCEMRKITELAEKYKLPVLEDACEAHGASHKFRKVGHWGMASAYSFYIAHMVCCGEGGMVSTGNRAFADAVNSTRNHGRRDGALYFDFPRRGYNSKMNDLEASIGLEGLHHFQTNFARRTKIREEILKRLAPVREHTWFSEQDKDCVNCPHGLSFTLKSPDSELFEGFTKALEDGGIHWKRNFGCIPTHHGAFKDYWEDSTSFPESEHVGKFGLHIGCHQYLTPEDINTIDKTINGFFNKI